ncbi:MAG: glycosyltransferase family 9 protein [Candidatus Paceibacterota bacterium]|jgi:ADP-heptose:LPS heptosyltransferase
MKIRKAITFRASSIGDCLMAKYLLENIHAEFPQARCAIVVASRAKMIKDLFAAYPWIEVIEVNRRKPSSVMKLWREYRGSDLVVTQYSGKRGGKFGLASKLIARFLARRDGLIGFNDISIWNKLLFSKILPVRSDQAVAWHEREILKAAGVPVSKPVPTMVFVKDAQVLDRFSLKSGKFIIVHLFAGNAGRGMHPDKKRELLATLAKRNPEIKIIVSGGVSDKQEALRVSNNLPVLVVAGEVTLQELMNLISESSGVVSLDTGVAHLTAQLGRLLVILRTCLAPNWWFSEQYGPNAPITVFSHDEACADEHTYKDYPDCINNISMEAVVDAIK